MATTSAEAGGLHDDASGELLYPEAEVDAPPGLSASPVWVHSSLVEDDEPRKVLAPGIPTTQPVNKTQPPQAGRTQREAQREAQACKAQQPTAPPPGIHKPMHPAREQSAPIPPWPDSSYGNTQQLGIWSNSSYGGDQPVWPESYADTSASAQSALGYVQFGMEPLAAGHTPAPMDPTAAGYTPMDPSAAAFMPMGMPTAMEDPYSNPMVAGMGWGVSGDENIVEQFHRETGISMSELQALHNQGILSMVPRNNYGKISSLGSIRHAAKKCSPCLFWFRHACVKGLLCDYCHFKHEAQRNKRIRPSKKTREQAKEQARTRGDCEAGEDNEEHNPQEDI